MRNRFKNNLIAGLVVLLIALLTSCITEKKRMEICSHCPVKDSIRIEKTVETFYKDTTIYITQAGPVQYLENPCRELCDSFGNLKKFEISRRTNGIVGTIKSVGNSIVFDCKTDSLKRVIERQKQIIKESESKFQIKTLPPIVTNELTKMQSFWIILARILLAFNLIFFGWKGFKYYKKFHLPIP